MREARVRPAAGSQLTAVDHREYRNSTLYSYSVGTRQITMQEESAVSVRRNCNDACQLETSFISKIMQKVHMILIQIKENNENSKQVLMLLN